LSKSYLMEIAVTPCSVVKSFPWRTFLQDHRNSWHAVNHRRTLRTVVETRIECVKYPTNVYHQGMMLSPVTLMTIGDARIRRDIIFIACNHIQIANQIIEVSAMSEL